LLTRAEALPTLRLCWSEAREAECSVAQVGSVECQDPSDPQAVNVNVSYPTGYARASDPDRVKVE
jgi:hypothetical protein